MEEYPWHWSIYNWIKGDTAESLKDEFKVSFSKDLGLFLKEMWSANSSNGPFYFEQNFFRGGPLIVYDEESREVIKGLKDILDVKIVQCIWEKSLETFWDCEPVWVHGDLFPANIIVEDNHLKAVIDFGNMCIGDPACDLAITWTFFDGESRKMFKEMVEIDQNTWQRARGWTLWKALISLNGMDDKSSHEAKNRFSIIDALISEHVSEKSALLT